MHARYPAEFHIPTLRDVRVPSPTGVRRALAKRVVWLEDKIAARQEAGLATGYYVDELAAIALLMGDDELWPSRLERERANHAELTEIIAEDA